MTNFPTQGKITAPSGNPALAPSAPVRGEKASTVGSSQPAAKQTAREAAISTRYQSHSSGIVITTRPPSIVHQSLSDALTPSDAGTFDHAYLYGAHMETNRIFGPGAYIQPKEHHFW